MATMKSFTDEEKSTALEHVIEHAQEESLEWLMWGIIEFCRIHRSVENTENSRVGGPSHDILMDCLEEARIFIHLAPPYADKLEELGHAQ